MLTYRAFVRVLILVVFEFTFRCRCVEYQKKCYRVDVQDVCFFRPAAEWITWQDAWQICRRNKATLPIIRNEATQEAFKNYATSLNLVDRDDLWMAGREIRGLEWKWLTGTTANIKYHDSSEFVEDFYVQGVLTNDMVYSRDSPGNENNYVCQFFGAVCQSNDSISLSKGCLLLDSDEVNGRQLNLYDARNKCVSRGGDLVVIDSQEDRNRIREVITRIRNVAKVWIGLRRQWWIWSATDSAAEMTYSNWLPNHGFKPNQGCIVVEMKGHKWQQESCNSSKTFICQAEIPSIEDTGFKVPPAYPITTIAVSAVAGISFLVVAIILAVLITFWVWKRKARPRQSDVNKREPTDRSYQDLQDSLRSDYQYTQLQGVTNQPPERNPDYQNISDYVGGTRPSSYLEIIP